VIDSALDNIVALIPAFKQSVIPPLHEDVAECLAVYWTIVTANDSIDSTSATQIAQRIIPLVISQPWSFWYGYELGFQARLVTMCQTMIVGKRIAFAMGAGRASPAEQRALFIMNVAKAALVSSGEDDTNEESLYAIMEHLGEFHEKVWPIIRSAGTPRPMTPVAVQQQTGCFVMLISGVGIAVATIGIVIGLTS